MMKKQNILLPCTTDMSRKDNNKLLYSDEHDHEWRSDFYFNEDSNDTETFCYMHYDRSNQIMVQAVYLGNYSYVCADIKGEPFSMITYDSDGKLEGTYDNTYAIPMYVDNGTTVNLMPTTFYEKAKFLHHLPQHDASGEHIKTGNGSIACHFWMDIIVKSKDVYYSSKFLYVIHKLKRVYY